MGLQDDLITMADNVAVQSAYAKTIKEFKDLKVQELAYVYFMCDHRSPFAVYALDQRHIEVKNSIFDKDSKWKLTPNVQAAMDQYNDLIETSAVKLLKAARESVNKLEAYFREVDLMMLDGNLKPIYKASDLVNTLEKMGKVIDGITRLEEIVMKEEKASNQNRGGVIVNKYSN